jgi:hypothetical protein
MDRIIVSNMNYASIFKYLKCRCLTIKCADINIIFGNFPIIHEFVTRLMISGYPELIVDNLMYYYDINHCCIGFKHFDHYMSIRQYYIDNCNNMICEVCMRKIIKYSNKMINKIGKAEYKRLYKIYKVIRRFVLHDILNFDCIFEILYKLLY